MIHTVFCAPADPAEAWRSELLAHAWTKAGQPGELDRFVPGPPGALAPCHPAARDVPAMIWSPHPYTGDLYPPYQLAASVMEWLFVEPVEGTILLLEPTCVPRAAIEDEVGPGEARGAAWERPRGEGPFGLGPGLEFLTSFCVDRTLELPAVTLPVLIHSSDLRKIAARWLELMSLIRAETAGKAPGPAREADRIAYAIAAAEARVPHATADLLAADGAEGPLLDSRRPVLAADGREVWDPGSHCPGTPIVPDDARPGPGRELLRLLAEVDERRAQRQDAAFLKPRRQQGVREGRLLGTLFLEIPGRADTVSLNSSGAAIWEVCDGNRSLSEVNRELERRFDMPQGSLQADVEVVVRRLESIGALRLEQP